MEQYRFRKLDLTKAEQSGNVFRPVIDKFAAWYNQYAAQMNEEERRECQYVIDNMDPKTLSAWVYQSDHPLHRKYITDYDRDLTYPVYLLMRLFYVDFDKEILSQGKRMKIAGAIHATTHKDGMRRAQIFENSKLARMMQERYGNGFKSDGFHWPGSAPPRPQGINWPVVGSKTVRRSFGRAAPGDVRGEVVYLPEDQPDDDFEPGSTADSPEDDNSEGYDDEDEGFQATHDLADHLQSQLGRFKQNLQRTRKRARAGSEEQIAELEGRLHDIEQKQLELIAQIKSIEKEANDRVSELERTMDQRIAQKIRQRFESMAVAIRPSQEG